ncbi:MAG: response regulator [Candidatus Levybacteria bacterium]|nr:response regulator [Candidatus Levybacteria bacterium]
MKVLLIDDDEAILSVYSTSLKSHGHEIITAVNGKAGLEKAKTEKPDVVLLDQVLPDIQGNEVLRLLKDDSETKDIPVAMLSNFGQNDLIQKALNTGAVDYIRKYEIEPDYLDTKIKAIMKSKQSQADNEQTF